MADGHGGYRRPQNPAPVSGPGALSRRTDGQPGMVAPGGEYGSRKDMEQIQSGAPMAEAAAPAAGAGPTAADLVPLGAPTANPGEPVTAGADLGAGMGPQGAGILDDNQISDEQLRPMLKSLEAVANLPGSTPQTRSYVRLLKAKLNGQLGA